MQFYNERKKESSQMQFELPDYQSTDIWDDSNFPLYIFNQIVQETLNLKLHVKRKHFYTF